jgi:twinkle protein
MKEDDSTFLHHAPCPACGSKDNLGVYTDGHEYCFGCGYHKNGEQMTAPATTTADYNFVHGTVTPLNKRKLDFDTLQKFNYEIGESNKRPVQIANYYDRDRVLVAQKLRYPDKSFQWIGEAKDGTLFGQHLWRDKGKMVIVTEGEIDCLSVSKVNGNKFPVVSVKTGAQGAKKDLLKELEWLESFETVVLMFDQDEAGKKAALECAKIFSPNKAKVCTLPMKDANEMLVAGKVKELTDCIWSAKAYRPDGIVLGADLWNDIQKEDDYVTVQYPFSCLNKKTHGLRKGELVTITAGSGVGKSSFCRHLALHLLKEKFSVGYLALEENVKRSVLGIMGIEMSKPLHLTREGVKDSEMKRVFDATVGNGNFYLYNHFGSTASDNLLAKIRYLAKGCDVDFVILDHLHMALSSIGDETTNDERKLIDYTVSKLRTLVEETGIGLILVSHLKRPEGNKGYEDGVAVSMNSLRGSASIGQLSDMIISMSRDLQSEGNLAQVNVLKNRFSGETGKACTLHYDLETGCLQETQDDVNNDF